MSKKRVLAEYRVTLTPAPTEPQAAPAEDRDDSGLRTKFGGEPTWIQHDATPACSRCRSAMTFVGQIDSFEHDSPDNPNRKNWRGPRDYVFGDVGIIYVFFCFECTEAKCVVQF